MSEAEWRENLKRGDEVSVRGLRNHVRFERVERCTPKQIILTDGYRFWKSNGRAVEKGVSLEIRAPSQEDKDSLEVEHLYRQLYMIVAHRDPKLTLTQLRAMFHIAQAG